MDFWNYVFTKAFAISIAIDSFSDTNYNKTKYMNMLINIYPAFHFHPSSISSSSAISFFACKFQICPKGSSTLAY